MKNKDGIILGLEIVISFILSVGFWYLLIKFIF
jgi:hypothetical protein